MLVWLPLSLRRWPKELVAVCIETMKANSTVKELLLSFCRIDDAIADALAKGLKENSTLTSLDLSSNEIGDGGEDALSKRFKENSTLTRLNLSYNKSAKVLVLY